MNFILFNGPPRSGKDTGAMIAMDFFKHTHLPIWEKFSFPNKRMFAGMMDTDIDTSGTVYPYEKTKDEIVPVLGVSYRQFQIDVSEDFLKVKYGEDIFGRLLLSRCNHWARLPIVYIISDCGFQTECN